jgi:hypothetical protein
MDASAEDKTFTQSQADRSQMFKRTCSMLSSFTMQLEILLGFTFMDRFRFSSEGAYFTKGFHSVACKDSY